jgi:hypothetical protein
MVALRLLVHVSRLIRSRQPHITSKTGYRNLTIYPLAHRAGFHQHLPQKLLFFRMSLLHIQITRGTHTAPRNSFHTAETSDDVATALFVHIPEHIFVSIFPLLNDIWRCYWAFLRSTIFFRRCSKQPSDACIHRTFRKHLSEAGEQSVNIQLHVMDIIFATASVQAPTVLAHNCFKRPINLNGFQRDQSSSFQL